MCFCHPQLEAFLGHFPREQLFVGISERFHDKRLEATEHHRLWQFLGVRDAPLYNQTEFAQHAIQYNETLTGATICALYGRYRQPTLRLYRQFLSEPIAHWESWYEQHDAHACGESERAARGGRGQSRAPESAPPS